MTLAIAISTFFGLVAALSLASCYVSLTKALRLFREIRAELRLINRPKAIAQLRRPKEAFARALAV